MFLKQRLKFYFLRLRNASFPEMIHRAKEALFILRLRALFKKGKAHLQIPSIDYALLEALQLPDFQFDVDDQVLGALLGGQVFTLNGDRQRIEKFETEWQGVFFADVPMALPQFDIRMVWEPARLQHLTILMLYYHMNRGLPDSEQVQGAAKKAVMDWVGRNSFLAGPHYQSAMECGLRIPVFFYALKILPDLKPGEKSRIIEAIYQHAWWIFRRLSLYSSLGNHTVCECLGLVFAGAIFGSAPEGRAWMERALALLQQELHHQILDDGGPAEQSLSYLRFILDLYWLIIDFLEKNGLHDCRGWKARPILGEAFYKAFQDDRGQVPALGDSDDGYAVAPGIYPRIPYAG